MSPHRLDGARSRLRGSVHDDRIGRQVTSSDASPSTAASTELAGVVLIERTLPADDEPELPHGAGGALPTVWRRHTEGKPGNPLRRLGELRISQSVGFPAALRPVG